MKQIEDRVEANGASAKAALAPIDRNLFGGVEVTIEARLGSARTTIGELMALKPGSVVTLDTGVADPVDLYVNNARVARGEIVAVGDSLGIRIVEIAKP